jgi:hypothetical protein
VSYPNYSEVFGNIYAVDASTSDSAIDVNPADGQELTGLIPFFGDTAFGAALRGAVTVAFKHNSIYLLDPSVKASGGNPVQKIETNGIGCTCPASIAVSKNAIFFASEAGIYALRRDLTIQYVGKMIERLWEEKTSFAQLPALAAGHHDPIGKKYKLSYPVLGATQNSGVFTYNHSQEDEGTTNVGAWTRYDNYPATGWANLNADEFFASTKGWVYRSRRNASAFDFADLGEAISATLLIRATDFGDSGNRKQVRHIIGHYRPITSLTSISAYSATDAAEVFTNLDSFVVTKGSTSTDLGDLGGKKVVSLAHSLPTERALYFQIKFVENGLNEGIDFIGLDYLVLLLSHHGIEDAISTLK